MIGENQHCLTIMVANTLSLDKYNDGITLSFLKQIKHHFVKEAAADVVRNALA